MECVRIGLLIIAACVRVLGSAPAAAGTGFNAGAGLHGLCRAPGCTTRLVVVGLGGWTIMAGAGLPP